MRQIQNARIRSTSLGREDHGCFTAYIHCEGEGWGQGFGGYALDQYDSASKKRHGWPRGIDWLMGVMDALEVEAWEKLPGTPCRVDHDHGKVYRIGHYLKDKWFDPADLAP